MAKRDKKSPKGKIPLSVKKRMKKQNLRINEKGERKKFGRKLTVPEPRKPQLRTPEPISPTRRKMLDKQKQDQMVKQNLTQDYAFTGTPGAIAEPAGVTIPASKKPKLALRGGGRAYGRNS